MTAPEMSIVCKEGEMRRAIFSTIAVTMAVTVAACSAAGPEASRTDHGGPVQIDAATIARAYAQDADEADVEFVGHPLIISGDVVDIDRTGRRLILATGSSAERLPATIKSSPVPVSPHDLIVLRCDRIDRDGNRPRVSACLVTAVVPARIAGGS